MKLVAFEARWAEAALGAIFPGSSDAGLRDIRTMNVRGYLSEVMQRLPFRAALGLRIAVWLVALAPPFAVGRLARFERLAQGERERVIAMLAASKWYAVRSLVFVLKAIGALLYAADSRVRARLASNDAPPTLMPIRLRRAPPT